MEGALQNALKAVLPAAKAAAGVAFTTLMAGSGLLVAMGSAAMLLVMTPVLLGTAALCILLGLAEDGVA